MLALTGAGVLHAQRGRSVSCDKILNPNKVESFTQRFSCAGQAMEDGDEARAFNLMAPIYKDAIGSKSNTRVNSQEKLRAIVKLKLGAAADQLVGQYGPDSVYAAMADASGINPITGTATKGASKVVLPAELVTAVANAINAGPARGPIAGPAEEGGVPQAPPLTPEEMAIVEEVTARERQQAATQFKKENAELLAIDYVLDLMFRQALANDNWDLAQNLIEAIKTGKGFDAIRNAYNAKSDMGQNKEITMYNSLDSNLGSWRLTKLLRMGPAEKSKEDLFGEWIDTVPAPGLTKKLLDAGVPDKSTVALVQRYYDGDASVETPDLAFAKAVMLMRNAYRVIFDPVRGVPFAVSTDDRFAQIADIYLALNQGLIANKFRIDGSTKFNVQSTSEKAGVLTAPGESYTLQELNIRLGDIIATLTADVLIGKNFSHEERSRLRAALKYGAIVGGVIGVAAGIVYLGHKGYLGAGAQEYLSPVATKVVGGLSAAGAVLSDVAGKGISMTKTAATTVSGYIPAPVKTLASSAVGLMRSAGTAVLQSAAITGVMGFFSSGYARMMGAAPAAQPAAAPVASPAATPVKPMPRETPEPIAGMGNFGN